MKRIVFSLLILALIVIVGYATFRHFTAVSSVVEYQNNQYNFTFTLPNDWRGYSVVNETWTGYPICASNTCPTQTGPEILLRNPRWTAEEHYQDIPVMIFTHTEWTAVATGTLIVSAAPIPPTEFGENINYVFALPARYNYAFPEGWQEVQTIIAGNPLHGF